MDWDRVEGNWKQFKGRVKEKWGNLTDDDLDRVAGQREQSRTWIKVKNPKAPTATRAIDGTF